MRLTLTTVLATLALLTACSDDNIDGGATGIIKFGEGDCQLDQSFWYYYNYNGYAYCINKNIRDTLNDAYGKSLYENSDSVYCANGKYTFALQPGNYYIFIREYPNKGFDNLVTVHYKSITETNLFFYRCL